MIYPALKAADLLALLERKPLSYSAVRSGGSHRRLQSSTGHPPLTFAFQLANSLKVFSFGVVGKLPKSEKLPCAVPKRLLKYRLPNSDVHV